jgi:hypothetical protein
MAMTAGQWWELAWKTALVLLGAWGMLLVIGVVVFGILRSRGVEFVTREDEEP